MSSHAWILLGLFLGFRDSLVKDHCHVSGLVRGFLCPSCNVTEGRSDHNLASWRSGTTPAALMGIEEVYINPVTGPIQDLPCRTTVGEDGHRRGQRR